MAIEFEIHGSTVRVKASAAASEEEVLDVIERATQSPDFEPRSAVLVDIRGVSDAPSTEHLAATGQLLAREAAGHFSRVAFIAEGPVQFGLTRILGGHADAGGLEVQVFEREEDALHWIRHAPGAR